MPPRSKPPARFPSSIYDYAAKRTVDRDVQELDLVSGWWIRCASCFGRKQRLRHPFDPDAWYQHKRKPSHQATAEAMGGNSGAATLHSNVDVDFATILNASAERDMGLISVHQQAVDSRVERDRKAEDAILALTRLVTEQQQDIAQLYAVVHGLKKRVSLSEQEKSANAPAMSDERDRKQHCGLDDSASTNSFFSSDENMDLDDPQDG